MIVISASIKKIMIIVYDTWICPCCGHHYEVDYDDYEYCPKCGQKIDWSDEE